MKSWTEKQYDRANFRHWFWMLCLWPSSTAYHHLRLMRQNEHGNWWDLALKMDSPDRLSQGQRHQHKVVLSTMCFVLNLEDRTIPGARAVSAGCPPALELELDCNTEMQLQILRCTLPFEMNCNIQTPACSWWIWQSPCMWAWHSPYIFLTSIWRLRRLPRATSNSSSSSGSLELHTPAGRLSSHYIYRTVGSSSQACKQNLENYPSLPKIDSCWWTEFVSRIHRLYWLDSYQLSPLAHM